MKQYRALLTCIPRDDGTCSYCREPAKTFVVGRAIPGVMDEKLWPSYEEALTYGQGMASKVYGASAHRVSVEEREIGGWEASENPDRGLYDVHLDMVVSTYATSPAHAIRNAERAVGVAWDWASKERLDVVSARLRKTGERPSGSEG